MEILSGRQGDPSRRNKQKKVVQVKEFHCCLYVTFSTLHSYFFHVVPVLNGLEEHEDEEQLLPVLPVFLLR